MYIDTIDTTTKWDSLFTELMISKLALALLNPLTGSGSTAVNLRNLLLAEVAQLNSQARAIAGQEGNDSGSSSWNNARFL